MTSSSSSTSGPHWRGLFGPLLAGLLIILACGSGPTRTTREIDLAPFKDLAKSSDCSETRNRLFLIDRALVLWDREGTCVDAAYLVRLHAGAIDQVLCELRDSIAGQVKVRRDLRFQEMFETIVANLEAPDLGLGPRHTVQAIDF